MSKLAFKIEAYRLSIIEKNGSITADEVSAIADILSDVEELEMAIDAYQSDRDIAVAAIRQAKLEAYIEFRDAALAAPHTEIWDICADLLNAQETANE